MGLAATQSGWLAAAVAVAIPVGFLSLLFIVALAEKRLVVPYQFVPPDRHVPLPPYVQAMVTDIAAAGFQFGGLTVHRKYPFVKILGTVWLSPTRETLVYSGSGTVAGLPQRQTWLFTPLGDGRVLVTTDQNDEGDQTGQMVYRRRLNSRFPELYVLHGKRVTDLLPQVRSFAEPTAFEALINLWAGRAAELLRRGRARWADEQQEYWRHTPRGALAVTLGFFPQAAGALTQFWRAKMPPIAANVGPTHDQDVRAALGR